jgi:4-hydroxy-3-polyprenylbenzoate decarboxylase
MAAADLVLAMTGASGAAYGVRLLEVFLAAGRTVHLVISPSACDVLATELGLRIDLSEFRPGVLLPRAAPAWSFARAAWGPLGRLPPGCHKT